jgi:hypothetical protein
MTNLGDVMRQIETALCDPHDPPTADQQEALDRLLFQVYAGTVEFRGSK